MPFLLFDPSQTPQSLQLQLPTIHRLIPNTGPTHGGIEVTILPRESTECSAKADEQQRLIWMGCWSECKCITEMQNALIQGIEVTILLKESPKGIAKVCE